MASFIEIHQLSEEIPRHAKYALTDKGGRWTTDGLTDNPKT